MKVTDKPWGKEELYFKGPYAVKKLYINKGERTSLQYHAKKIETLVLLKGKILLSYQDDEDRDIIEIIMVPGDMIHIRATTIHRFKGIGDENVLYEVSTLELDDVVRIEDDYKRIEEK